MPIAQETMTALGYPEAPIFLIGALELILTLLFLFPPTAVLGAVLMMAILGGAMVTQMRAASPLFSHTLFLVAVAFLPLYVALMLVITPPLRWRLAEQE